MILSIGIGITLGKILPELLTGTISITFMIIGFIFFLLGKKYITQPRLGVVKLGIKQKSRKLKTVIVLSINLVLLLIIYIFRFLNPEFRFPVYLDGLFTGLLFVTVPLCFAAYFLQYPRLYFTAILGGISFFLSDIFSIFIPEPLDALTAFFLVSGAIITVGIVALIKFIRKYSLAKEEMT
ncbi:MAG: hypothetical protein ACFFBV_13640 [Promethearchaeota archaeon]